jgi:hypothetical protein
MGLLACALSNIGHGPALQLEVFLGDTGQTADLTSTALGVAADPVEVSFTPPFAVQPDDAFTILVRYESIAGELYESEIVYTETETWAYRPQVTRVERLDGDPGLST